MYSDTVASGKRATKGIIKNAFLDIYRCKPLGKITVNSLINECNVSRGTFYFYYEDIHSLYRDCENDLIELLEKGLSDVNMSTLRADYEKHVMVLTEFLEGHVALSEELKCFLKGSEQLSFKRTWFESIYNDFEKILQFSQEIPVNRQQKIVRFYAGGATELFTDWVLNDFKEPAAEIATAIARMLFKGIFSKNY
jgi:AcrR family transcriptional regulator